MIELTRESLEEHHKGPVRRMSVKGSGEREEKREEREKKERGKSDGGERCKSPRGERENASVEKHGEGRIQSGGMDGYKMEIKGNDLMA